MTAFRKLATRPYPADNSIPLYVESLTGTYWSDDPELPANKHFKAFEEMLADPGQD